MSSPISSSLPTSTGPSSASLSSTPTKPNVLGQCKFEHIENPTDEQKASIVKVNNVFQFVKDKVIDNLQLNGVDRSKVSFALNFTELNNCFIKVYKEDGKVETIKVDLTSQVYRNVLKSEALSSANTAFEAIKVDRISKKSIFRLVQATAQNLKEFHLESQSIRYNLIGSIEGTERILQPDKRVVNISGGYDNFKLILSKISSGQDQADFDHKMIKAVKVNEKQIELYQKKLELVETKIEKITGQINGTGASPVIATDDSNASSSAPVDKSKLEEELKKLEKLKEEIKDNLNQAENVDWLAIGLGAISGNDENDIETNLQRIRSDLNVDKLYFSLSAEKRQKNKELCDEKIKEYAKDVAALFSDSIKDKAEKYGSVNLRKKGNPVLELLRRSFDGQFNSHDILLILESNSSGMSISEMNDMFEKLDKKFKGDIKTIIAGTTSTTTPQSASTSQPVAGSGQSSSAQPASAPQPAAPIVAQPKQPLAASQPVAGSGQSSSAPQNEGIEMVNVTVSRKGKKDVSEKSFTWQNAFNGMAEGSFWGIIGSLIIENLEDLPNEYIKILIEGTKKLERLDLSRNQIFIENIQKLKKEQLELIGKENLDFLKRNSLLSLSQRSEIDDET